MKVGAAAYKSVSLRTRNPVKRALLTSVRDHVLICNHQVAWEDFRVLGRVVKSQRKPSF